MITKRCSYTRKCGVSYTPNYRWKGDAKRNTMTVSKHPFNIIFISSKVAFTMRMLDMFANLLFRAGTSWSAAAFAYRRTHGSVAHMQIRSTFRILLSTAVVYYLAAREMEEINRQHDLNVEGDIPASLVQEYGKHLHDKVLVPDEASAVKEIVGDGNAKISMPCGYATGKRVGRPRKGARSTTRTRSHGWFMLVEPRMMRIVGIQPMMSPENNEVKVKALKTIMPHYKNLDCFIHDRNCSFESFARSHAFLKQIRFYPIDRFHSVTHKKGCKNNPRTIKRLARRVKGVNTSAAEQIFSWFKRYSGVLNEMPKGKHSFLVMLFCRWHNIHASADDYWAMHPPKAFRRQTSVPYGC